MVVAKVALSPDEWPTSLALRNIKSKVAVA
jgi:hypothetical protein